MNPWEADSDKREWIESTLLDIGDGQADENQVEAFRELLLVDREARLVYLRVSQLDGMLSVAPFLSAAEPVGATWKTEKGSSSPWPQRIVGGLVSVGLVATIALIFWISRADPVSGGLVAEGRGLPLAELVMESEAVIDGAQASVSRTFEEGAVSLERGVAQLSLRGGAQVVLDGRCGFELIDGKTLKLSRGRAWVHCPVEARGFRVLLPENREVIDQGADFGVEVGAGGEMSIQAFGGILEVKEPGRSDVLLESGQSLVWKGASAPASLGRAELGGFVTPNGLIQNRLQGYRQRMKARSDLLLYYDFSSIEGGLVENQSLSAAPGSDGLVHGANLVGGRVEGMNALQFEYPGDSVSLDLKRPPEVRAFTVAIWVKIDRIHSPLAALLTSDGWRTGSIHFQISGDRSIRAGIRGLAAFESASSVVKPGVWQLLAVSWDLDGKRAQLFVDGMAQPLKPTRRALPFVMNGDPQFGSSRLGAWSWQSPGHAEENRDLKGRVDELMIFDRGLSAEDIKELYEDGK